MPEHAAERPHGHVPSGSWVELHRVVLPPGERAPQVPAETQRVPLELRVKGFLVRDAVWEYILESGCYAAEGTSEPR